MIDKTGEPELVYRDAAPTTARKSVADRLRGGKKERSPDRFREKIRGLS